MVSEPQRRRDAEKATGNCRRCADCAESAHHWLPAAEEEYDYDCKHCDAIGKQCPVCDGYGGVGEFDENCPECDGFGVILIVGGKAKVED